MKIKRTVKQTYLGNPDFPVLVDAGTSKFITEEQMDRTIQRNAVGV